MRLVLTDFKESINGFLRSGGYAFLRREGRELSFARRLSGGDYPRFHLYAHSEKAAVSNLVINLHLDQKKPSYEGVNAHSGEYGGELVETEARRIEELFRRLCPPKP